MDSQQAVALYQKRRKSINALIKSVQNGLINHEERASSDPQNYGFVGELGHIEEVLVELKRFLRG